MNPWRNKILAVLVVSVFLFNIIPVVSSAAKGGTSPNPASIVGKGTYGSRVFTQIISLLEGDNIQLALRVFFMVWVTKSMDAFAEDIENNLSKYILLNPDLRNPGSLNLLRYFVSLLYPVYILAIIVSGFYIIFIPGSPLGRSRAKSLLSKLVISMVLVSFSSEIMGMLLYLTEQSTVEIIGDEYNPSAYASIVALEFSSIVYCVRNLVLLVNIPNAFLAGGGTIMAFFGGILNPHGFMYEFGHAMHAIELIEVETVWCTPLILLVILMLIGVHGLLSIRYFMVLLWAMLMPFTIFFSSFEFTRGIGRSMIEQTLLWSSLQVFYGVTIVLIAVGITIVPPSMYNSYGIGLHKNDIPYVGAAMDKLDVRGDLFISIFSFTSMFLLFLGPLLMFTFFQKLLPP